VEDVAVLDSDGDALNLIINAVLTLLDHPEMDLDQIILANYQPSQDEDPDYEYPEEGETVPEETDQQARERIIRTVRSWVS
jgi:hypothetical protein